MNSPDYRRDIVNRIVRQLNMMNSKRLTSGQSSALQGATVLLLNECPLDLDRNRSKERDQKHTSIIAAESVRPGWEWRATLASSALSRFLIVSRSWRIQMQRTPKGETSCPACSARWRLAACPGGSSDGYRHHGCFHLGEGQWSGTSRASPEPYFLSFHEPL